MKGLRLLSADPQIYSLDQWIIPYIKVPRFKLWGRPLTTLAIWRGGEGEGVINWSKLQTDSTKNLPILKGGCQKVRKIDDVVYRWSPCLLLKCFVVSCLHRLDTLANNQRLLCATECTAILASVDECQSSSRHQHCLVIIITVPSNCVPTVAAPPRAAAVVVI